MSRELKFRVWVSHQKRMIGWDNYKADIIAALFDPYEKFPVMQYTGLKDIGGTEAYEKDYDEDGNMIDWCEKCCGYQFFQIDIPTKDVIHCQNCEGNFMVQDHIPEFKIIGNIYENQPPDHVPELHPK